MPDHILARPHRRQITSKAVGIGVATGAYGLSFGAISVASGLDAWQTQTLSLLMFTGGSQFALVGVLGAGGGGFFLLYCPEDRQPALRKALFHLREIDIETEREGTRIIFIDD